MPRAAISWVQRADSLAGNAERNLRDGMSVDTTRARQFLEVAQGEQEHDHGHHRHGAHPHRLAGLGRHHRRHLRRRERSPEP